MREVFQIPRSGGSVMENGKLTSDGTTDKDLAAITVESMQEYTGSTLTKFEELFAASLDLVNSTLAIKEQDLQDAITKKNAAKRNEEINELVDSLLITIDNLPYDAQARAYAHLTNILVKKNNVKETSSTEVSEEGSDLKAAKSTRGRNKASESVG